MSTSNEPTQSATSIDHAIAAFRDGKPVLIHDAADREGETDLVYPAGAVTPEAVARLRDDAGGLICVALSDAVADTFELPYAQQIIDHPTAVDHELGYDERSSFSLTVNHRDTYTGITDEDRALTISALADAAADPEHFDFAEAFRSPGHIHLLRAAPGLLSDRRGHTELGIALADAAGLPPAVVVCEMLDSASGRARSPAAAREYADEHDLPYLEERDIVDRLG